MYSPSLAPGEIVRVVRRNARSSRMPDLIANPHEELPGASRFLGIPDLGFDHACWIGAGSQVLEGNHLRSILNTVNRDGFFTDRRHHELEEQDAEIHGVIQQFLKGFETYPVFIWLRSKIWMWNVGTAHAFGGKVRLVQVDLSPERPFGATIAMNFNDPAFPSRRVAIDTSRIRWQDSIHLPPRHQWALVKVQRHLRTSTPGSAPRYSYSEQIGISRRGRDYDAGLQRILHPVEFERAHPVVIDNSGTIRYGVQSATEAQARAKAGQERPRVISANGLFDYVEMMVWQVRQERTVSGGVSMKIEDLRFAMDRRSGEMLHITTGFDFFRPGFANPEMSAWGMWLAPRL